MFEHLKPFQKVLVTGPQRSGTHICAKMISEDLGLELIDDDIWGNDRGNLQSVIANRTGFVTPCPGMARWIHDLADQNTAVVFMMRNLDDIYASQKRIGWTWDGVERELYAGTPEYAKTQTSAEVKQMLWVTTQRANLQGRGYTQSYEALANHPSWVPKAKRRFFLAKQTEEDSRSKEGVKSFEAQRKKEEKQEKAKVRKEARRSVVTEARNHREALRITPHYQLYSTVRHVANVAFLWWLTKLLIERF